MSSRIASRVSSRAPKRFQRLQGGSVNSRWLTQRAQMKREVKGAGGKKRKSGWGSE